MKQSRVLIGVVSALWLFAAGCGGGDETTTTAAPVETTVPVETTAAPMGDPTEEVTFAIETLFGAMGEADFDTAAIYIENGSDYIAELQGFADLAVGVSTEVTSVELLDDTTAIYVMDISIGGEVALPDSSGEAVYVDGGWVMSESSWNALAALAPPPETTVPAEPAE
jgi:hypothetical protein